MCTLAVSIYVLAVSKVAGFDRALPGTLERALAGTSDRPVLEDSGARDESGALELV